MAEVAKSVRDTTGNVKRKLNPETEHHQHPPPEESPMADKRVAEDEPVATSHAPEKAPTT